MAELVPLRAGDLAVDLAPHMGGTIVAFTRASERVLRDTPPTALVDNTPTLAGCYVMVPYCNRIADGRFSFGGEDFQLNLNFGKSPHSIHGNGWQREWMVAEAEPSVARLVLDHDPSEPGRAAEWPYAYRAEQGFVLMPDSLAVTLRLTNTDERDMPAGFGLHPYFDREGAQLTFAAERVWQTDERLLPTERTTVPDGWKAADGRKVDDLSAVDHAFEGWGGPALVEYEDRNLVITIEADPIFEKLLVFRADDKPFFAVEPISHIVDAVNRMEIPGNGLKVLSPGETIEGTITFRVEPLRRI